MATTTKTAKGNQAAAAPIGDGWDDAPRAGGGSGDGPEWLPHLVSFKEEVIAHKLSTHPDGSHIRPVVVGVLRVQQAYGEPRYFVDETIGDKTIRLAMPQHGMLTSALDCFAIDPAPKVRLAFMGESENSSKGQPAKLYDVRCQPKEAMLLEARKDALYPIHKANKAKRDAADAKEAKEKAAAGE